ncbi:mycothiol synthase [Nocardioides flavescens]|uniref:Mycothiol acetyltransferase n=1 Tax=Nocardioides flavescens TaxID=2691959 RepID=A0A6L7F0Z4_9ACTN|nr:mycothiol synthase [Nocardioides flavescens]MXG89892.1 mycothiol synthase [Nocardioides flavescens]
MLTPVPPESSWRSVVDGVRRACVAAGEPDPLDEAAQLRLTHHGLDGSTLWLTDEAGFALAHDGAVDLAVAPDERRSGHGTALAEAAFAGSGPVTAWSHGDHPAAARLAERHGLARVRELWVMRRPTSLPLPELQVPEGVTVRGYRSEDEAEVLRVNAAAFAHHPEQGSMDADDLAARMGEPWWDPAGLLVADDGDGLRGFHWTKQHDASLGEVYVVGIDPAAQGQGLGKVLTLAGLHHLAGLGVDEVLLYVESDNTPAVRVYSGLGFEHAASDTHVQYRRD